MAETASQTINPPHFIGRKQELAELNKLLKKRTASMIVIRGRRRIGKSRLVEQFATDQPFYSFAGLAPTPESTAQSQRDIFAAQLSGQTGLPEIQADDWSKLFQLLHEKTKTGRAIILFDEISWMGTKDPDFLGKIKHAWDQLFKKNPQLIFVICGSASAWIEENILSSTGFLGRISYTLTLQELRLQECNEFWQDNFQHISSYEKFKLLSVTGGVPRYLEEIDPTLSAEDNIAALCFRRGGILVEEFEHIFSNMFRRRTALYRDIVMALLDGPKEGREIANALGIELTGLFSEYLTELSLCGFITRDYAWNFKTSQDTRISQYRLSDNYLRFYLHYISKYKTKIERGSFEFTSLSSLPEWHSIIGLQFENLVLNNRRRIQDLLHIKPGEVAGDNPFFQRATKKHPGCQIDYMIQTRFNTLYIVEVKFSKNPVGKSVIQEVEQKIERLFRPHGFSCRPVLIHVNGVTDELLDSGYFAAIIDFSEFLNV